MTQQNDCPHCAGADEPYATFCLACKKTTNPSAAEREALGQNFLEAGEALAHDLANASYCETAGALRGFLDCLRSEPQDTPGDGAVATAFHHGYRSADEMGLRGVL